MPRYVVLRHDPPTNSPRVVHWDFMLEAKERLWTWALAEEPRRGATIAATKLPDHRQAYLTYEGPIAGDRGCVTRWDQGEYELLRADDQEILVQLTGARLRGRARFARSAPDAERWLVHFTPPPS